MNPMVIAAGATAVSGMMGYKGNMASAKAARQIGEYNAILAEQERDLLVRQKTQQESNMRKQSNKLVGAQRVATAASGIQMAGSPLDALADTFFNTELDALNIRFARDIDELNKTSEAALARASASARSAAFKTQAYSTLLSSGSRSAQLLA
tara:strand:- start:68 stop:523 length:456 start_codon:yes stop_codon:yes gene_type:complete